MICCAIDDAELGQLESKVSARLSGQIRGLHLEAHAAGLVLHGRARTYYVKQLVQEAVKKATPVPILANDIEVY